MKTAMISSQRQITLPKTMLDELKIQPNQNVAITLENQSIVIRPMKKSIVKQIGGSIKIPKNKMGVSDNEIIDETKKLVAKGLL